MLNNVLKSLENIKNWKAINIGESMQQAARDLGIKNSDFFTVLRAAITGKKISQPLNESMEILGKEKTLERIKKAY